MSKSTKRKSHDDDFRQAIEPANQSPVDQPHSSKLIKLEVSPNQIDAGPGKPSHSSGSTKTMAEKMKENEPYNIFFTTIPELPETINQKNSITFTDLLCPSLGELRCSLQLTFLLSTKWLMEQYEEQGQGEKPLVVLYGKKIEEEEKTLPLKQNVKAYKVNMKDEFGTHHAKIGIYVYKGNSVRVVVSTANLFYNDWNHYNQGLWISPLCSALSEDAAEAGESPTGFKSALIKFLQEYKMPVLNSWITYVKRADFSAVKVFLITSAPGDHKLISSMSQCPLLQVKEFLSKYCKLLKNKGEYREWDIIAQASSFGNLGKTEDIWLKDMVLKHLASHENQHINPEANIKIVYPTQNNVRDSHFGEEGGKCMAYSDTQHEKQKWLQNVLHQWKADRTQRTGIMPHIKTYCRMSRCQTKLAWFLLTSANISKAAWGYPYGGNIKVLSYEVGVLFLPHFFEEDYFQIENDNEDKSHLFPFMYDLPLYPYDKVDKPYTVINRY